MKLLIILICFAFCTTAEGKAKSRGLKMQTGYATFYTIKSCQREGTSGVLTASGKRYNESALTCALPFHPKKWGQKYRITNLKTGLSMIVTQTDYGPGRSAKGRGVIIDLTPAAFKALGGNLKDGRIKVKIELVKGQLAKGKAKI